MFLFIMIDISYKYIPISVFDTLSNDCDRHSKPLHLHTNTACVTGACTTSKLAVVIGMIGGCRDLKPENVLIKVNPSCHTHPVWWCNGSCVGKTPALDPLSWFRYCCWHCKPNVGNQHSSRHSSLHVTRITNGREAWRKARHLVRSAHS